MKQINNNKKQKGFSILAVILVIVAVIVAIGIWALSGQTNTSSSGSASASVQAASIMNDANVIKSEFDRLLINGNNAENIGFYLPGTTIPDNVKVNILDAVNGISLPKTSPKSFYNPNNQNEIGNWEFGYFKIRNVGTTNNPDPVIVISGIKDEICESINNSIYGSKTVPAFHFFPSNELSYSNTFDGITDLDEHLPEIAGWTQGCMREQVIDVSGNPKTFNNGTYFLVLKAN